MSQQKFFCDMENLCVVQWTQSNDPAGPHDPGGAGLPNRRRLFVQYSMSRYKLGRHQIV
ncbi:MAG: hypothetical protein QOH06_5618 [Acidobacteriota bacterium]|nr:hypothetical protein [Acidobacteriota bacterium]